jgi:hypothetical protein
MFAKYFSLPVCMPLRPSCLFIVDINLHVIEKNSCAPSGHRWNYATSLACHKNV